MNQKYNTDPLNQESSPFSKYTLTFIKTFFHFSGFFTNNFRNKKISIAGHEYLIKLILSRRFSWFPAA